MGYILTAKSYPGLHACIHVARLMKNGRNVRGPTKMRSITRSNGIYKIYVNFNQLGQPCGLRAANFANYISYLAKRGDISFKFTDWRKTDQKQKLWDVLNVIKLSCQPSLLCYFINLICPNTCTSNCRFFLILILCVKIG